MRCRESAKYIALSFYCVSIFILFTLLCRILHIHKIESEKSTAKRQRGTLFKEFLVECEFGVKYDEAKCHHKIVGAVILYTHTITAWTVDKWYGFHTLLWREFSYTMRRIAYVKRTEAHIPEAVKLLNPLKLG